MARGVIVAPVTTVVRGLESEVMLGVKDGLKGPCVANLDHVQSVPQRDLHVWLGRLSAGPTSRRPAL